MYYDWPDAEEAYTAKNEYLFGDNMIIAPVTSPVDKSTSLASESVWLPDGEWIEWPTGTHLKGPAQLKRSFSVRETPVYVRAGAIIPMAPAITPPAMPTTRTNSETAPDPLVVTVFPVSDGQVSSYRLYEDAGNSRAYQRGEAAWTTLRASAKAGELTVEISPVHGAYPGMPAARAYELRLPFDWPPESVMVNGQTLAHTSQQNKAGWRYEGNTLTTIVYVPRRATATGATIRVVRSAKLLARRTELDGFTGAMTRLREAYDNLNQIWPLGWSPDELIDAMQSGDRLSYQPESASSELSHYHDVLPQAIVKVKELTKDFTDDQKEQITRSDLAKKRLPDYKERVGRAVAEVSEIARDPK